jgi:hypothetical protein
MAGKRTFLVSVTLHYEGPQTASVIINIDPDDIHDGSIGAEIRALARRVEFQCGLREDVELLG